VLVLLGAMLPFAQVREIGWRTMGVRISASSVRRMTERAGATLVAVEEAEVTDLRQTLPPTPRGAHRQQVSVDGAMVPVRGGHWREVKTMVIGELGEGTTIRHSYCARMTDAEHFAEVATGELHRRGTFAADLVVGVADGALWCQHFYDYHLPQAVRVLDFPHAVEHLTQVAYACLGEGSPQALTWLQTQTTTLRAGDPQAVVAAVAALPVDQATDPGGAQQVRDKCASYLQTRLPQLAYADFIARGLPIGSGIVESANKLVVEARLKGAGMHWKPEHVDPMLVLRTALYSQTWDQRWQQLSRRQRQTARRSHPKPRPTPLLSTSAPPNDPPATARPVLGIPDRKPKTIVNGKPTLNHPWKRGYRLQYGTTDRAASQPITKM
jgi:hypothetical protein